MFKKILLVSAITALTTGMAHASAAPYVGASVGITNNTQNESVGSAAANTYGSYRGVPFKLFAGYGGVINQNFYLAGEVGATVATANLSNNTELKTSYDYGISILPGVMLTDHTLAYLRAGVVRAHFPETNDARVGGQFGGGLQTSVTQNIDMRLEYDFYAYKSVSTTLANNVTISAAPRADQVNLGLIYKFD